jgi:hypothetical protein
MNNAEKLSKITSILDNLSRRLDRAERADAQARADSIAQRQTKLAQAERELLALTQAEVVDFRVRADEALAPYGDVKTQPPVLGEDATAYKRRIIAHLQNRLPSSHELYPLALGHVSGDALDVFANQVIQAAHQYAYDPSSVPRGELRARDMSDPKTGLKITGFIGPDSFIKGMNQSGRKVLRIVNPKTGQVYLGPSQEYLRTNH